MELILEGGELLLSDKSSLSLSGEVYPCYSCIFLPNFCEFFLEGGDEVFHLVGLEE